MLHPRDKETSTGRRTEIPCYTKALLHNVATGRKAAGGMTGLCRRAGRPSENFILFNRLLPAKSAFDRLVALPRSPASIIRGLPVAAAGQSAPGLAHPV